MLQTISCLLLNRSVLLLETDSAALKACAAHLLRPAALDQLRIQHLLPPVQALHVCATLEICSYTPGGSRKQKGRATATNQGMAEG
jgi:hypothetical protein